MMEFLHQFWQHITSGLHTNTPRPDSAADMCGQTVQICDDTPEASHQRFMANLWKVQDSNGDVYLNSAYPDHLILHSSKQQDSPSPDSDSGAGHADHSTGLCTSNSKTITGADKCAQSVKESDINSKYCIPAKRARARTCDPNFTSWVYHPSPSSFVPNLHLSSDGTAVSNWKTFSFLMQGALAITTSNNIDLDEVVNNCNSGAEPVDARFDEAAFVRWFQANKEAHSIIKSKMPKELHDVADQHPKASDLWTCLTSRFSSDISSTPPSVELPSAPSHKISEVQQVPEQCDISTVTSKPCAASIRARVSGGLSMSNSKPDAGPDISSAAPETTLSAVPPEEEALASARAMDVLGDNPVTAEPAELTTSQRVSFEDSANSGRELCEFADSAHVFLDSHEPPSSTARTRSSSKMQLSEVAYMSFDCVNLGLWMTSADLWQLEGLHNFMVFTEFWPGGYFRLNLGAHPSDSTFDSVVLDLLKQHADSKHSSHVEIEGVHSLKGSTVPVVPQTSVEALDATRTATATKVAAALAAVPPKVSGTGAPMATAITAAAAAAAAKAISPEAAAGFEPMAKGHIPFMEADAFSFPFRVYVQSFQPVLQQLKKYRGIQGVLCNSSSMDVQPPTVGSSGKT